MSQPLEFPFVVIQVAGVVPLESLEEGGKMYTGGYDTVHEEASRLHREGM